MRSSRLLAILLRLQAQGRVSARALAQACEVSVRTIYRDVDALSAAGVPVYAEPGRLGGIALRDGYRTRLTGLDRPEAESLFLAGLPFAAEQLGLGAASDTVRLKLLAALPEAVQRDAQRVAARFHVDPVAWYQGPDDAQRLPELAAAVWSQHWLRMRYASWSRVAQHRVAPLGLVLKGGLWYLVAARDGQPRTWRVGSIEALTVEDEAAPPAPAGFDLRRWWEAAAADFERRLQVQTVQVRANPAGLRALARSSQALARAVAQAGPAGADGWCTLEIPAESIAAATADLLRLGPDVQAHGPPALLASVRQAVAALALAYADVPKARRPIR